VEGVPEFIHLARDFVFGDESVPVSEGRVSSVQTLSGSGALRVAAEWYVLSLVFHSLSFLSCALARRAAPVFSLMHVASPHAAKAIWISIPSWGNHAHIFNSVGLDVKHYRYLDDAGTGLDFEGFRDDLANKIPEGSVCTLCSRLCSLSAHFLLMFCRCSCCTPRRTTPRG
jgi:aspartate/tyrosine/aromatic aminotransferase